MPVARPQRKKRAEKKERDWKQIAFYVLSGLVAISMALGYVIAYLTPR